MDNFHRQTTAGPAAGCARSTLRPPPSLSGYDTGRLLGVGASASVWLVEDQGTAAPRALKVFDSSPTRPEHAKEQITQLNREIAVLDAVSHPHLLELHAVMSTDQGPAILMDYAGGGSLLNLVTARGRLSVGECITVLAPIAQVLAYLHSLSIQHGDVSPGNVLFTAEGKPLLTDLGMVRLVGEVGAPAAGTAGFAEVGRETGLSAGYASDVYSLSAIGWYALTGSPPGPARDRVPLTLLVPEVPAELLHTLEAGLHEDPEARPSAGEIAEAVLHSAAPQPLDLVSAVHPSVLPELLTRRAAGGPAKSPRRRFPVALGRFRSGKAGSKVVRPQRKAREPGRREARRVVRARARWRTTVPRTIAALLLLCGALLVGPNVLGTTGTSTNGTAQQYSMTETPDTPAPAQQGVQLSPEMRKRLANSDPVEALSALVAVRAVVLATGEAGLLSHVNVEDSEAMAADRDLLAGLRKRGHVFNGLSIRLQAAALTDSITVPQGGAAVAAIAVMSGYTETDSTGASVRQVAESKPQDLIFVLTQREGIWKIASVHTSDSV